MKADPVEENHDVVSPLERNKLFDPEYRDLIINGLCRGKSFMGSMKTWYTTAICRKCAEIIHRRDRIAKNLPCSHRILHHWDENNLIECARDSGKGWRRFSLLEEVWLRVIHSLREFGFPIDKIVQAKPAFFEPYSQEFPCSLMEYYIGAALGWNEPISLLVFADGFAAPLSYSELQIAVKLFGLTDHIHLNINEILRQTGLPDYSAPKFPFSVQLSAKEMQFLLFVRLKEFSSITIHFKNGEISKIDGNRECDLSERIGDLIRSNDYQKIELLSKEGKVVSIKQSISLKPDMESKN